MTTLKNDLLLRALMRQPHARTPVWLMRQAGRYLPEYRALREKAGDFLTLCKTPEMACEATLQPIRRFPLDAAIIFSDILTLPNAMGMDLHFAAGEGPKFAQPLRTAKAVDALKVPDPEDQLDYVLKAIQMVTHELDGQIPLIGFSGSPWTLAAYMVEGGGGQFGWIKRMMFKEPRLLHQLLNTLSESITAYLNAQIAAGVEVVMLFDTWGGLLSSHDYLAFSLRYMTHVISGLLPGHSGKRPPVIVFTKNGGQWLEAIVDTGCDGIALDWTTDIGRARERVGNKVALQGNMDPSVLYANPARVRSEVKRILNRFDRRAGHIFSLGHGIPPDVSDEHVAVLIDAVHEFSKPTL